MRSTASWGMVLCRRCRGFLAVVTAASSGELLRPQGSELGVCASRRAPPSPVSVTVDLSCSGRWPTPASLSAGTQGHRESQTLYQGSGAQPALVGVLVGEPGPDTGLAEPACHMELVKALCLAWGVFGTYLAAKDR